MKKTFFYLLNIINWLVFLLFIVIPKNQYEWMHEELGQPLTLPEDSDSLLVVDLLAVIVIILSFVIGLFPNGMGNWKMKIILTIIPLFGVVVKLFVIEY